METASKKQVTRYEQMLVNIIRSLPAERVAQILDYACYIQLQTNDDFSLDDNETEEEILADEPRWDAQFAETQDELAKMAEQVRAEIRAGRTQPMRFTQDGRIAPG
ncbi:MAG: hypothetical protein HY868_05190 [Chloroflexi bacterium]|nr:hypothetical protein [Chloroflexota bacterium]